MFLSFLSGMRQPTARLILSTIMLLSVPTPGHAQSFFEALFGGNKPAPAPNFRVQPQRLAPPGGYPQVSGGFMSRAPAISEGRSRTDDDDDNGRSKSGKGGQRTVCVRLCDGYYWPVSFQTKRSQFQKDARACESSCTGEARLFHYPSFGEIHDAVDNSGKPYARLPAAFLYRKKLVAGCTCRAEAWSGSEVSRHQVYAMEEAQEKARVAEEKAADDARMAVAEAKKAEAELRLAEAKRAGQNGGPKSHAKSKQFAVSDAVGDSAKSVVDAGPAVGAATVASAGGASVDIAPDLPPPPPTRNRRNREFDGAPVVRTAAVVEPARRPRAPTLIQQRPQAVRPTYAAAAPGPFAKKYTWPGD